MFRKLFNPVLLLLFAGLFFTAKETKAQLTLTGPNCVVKGSWQIYYLDGIDFSVTNQMNWCVNNGVFYDQQSSCKSGEFIGSVLIIWNDNQETGNITIAVTTPSGTTNLSITVTLVDPLNPGTLQSSSSQTIPYNTIPASFSASAASGGACSPFYEYLWESTTDFITFKTEAITENFTPGEFLTKTTYYRRKVTEKTTGAVGYLASYVSIYVSPPLQGGALTPATQNLSIGGFGYLCGFASGGNCSPNYTYVWESSTDGITFSPMGGAPNSGCYVFPQFKTAGVYYYQLKIECRGTITETVYSTVATINVAGPLDPGTLSPTTFNILSGTSPGQLTGTPAAGGTCFGDYKYNWQSSTTPYFANPSELGSSQNYTPGILNELTYFRRKVSCNGTEMFSNYITVNTYPPLNPGTIDGNTGPIAYNTSPGVIYNTQSASGGNCPSYNYQWEYSTDGGASYTNIGEAGAESYTPGSLTTTTIFRRKVKCGTEEWLYSNSVTVAVNPQLYGGYVTTGSTTITSGSVPATISNAVSASGGNCGGNAYTYMWEFSTGGAYSPTGNQSLSYSPVPLIQTTSFRRRVDCGGTETSYSNVIVFTVVPALNGGSISGNTGPFAVNTSPGLMNSTQTASGGICSSYNYQWQKSTDGGKNYTDISTATGLTCTPDLLATATSFRRRVFCGAETAYSNVVVAQVNNVLPGTIVPDQLTIAPGTSAGMLTANAARGGSCNGSYNYHWESSSDGVSWAAIPGAISQNYIPVVSQSTYYRRAVECNNITYHTNTAFITVDTLFSDQNYIRERSLVKPGVTTAEGADQLTNATDVMQTTQYFDGLGRLFQTVNKQITPLQKDVVLPVVYDQFGRETVKYLPYVSISGDGNFKPNAIPEQQAFNAAQFTTDQFYYGQTEFEASPLNRVMSSFAQGNSWAGDSRGAGFQYLINTEAENVQIWSVASASGSVPVSSGPYPSGRLYKNVTADEHGKEIVEYKDKEGKVILKKVQASDTRSNDHSSWLCTYYIYDDLNNLRYVIQPQAVKLMSDAGNWNLSPHINNFCFRYEYDQRNRMILKKVPGADEVYMVYDARDRLVMTQDAKLKAELKWMATVYENDLNRPVKTYLIRDVSYYNNPEFHRAHASESISYPVLSNYYTELLTETHYDNYTDLPAGLSSGLNGESVNNAGFITNYNAAPLYAQPLISSSAVKGMVTWTKVKVLGSSNTFISTVMLYDDRGRVIQTQSVNQTGGLDIATTQYDFSGKPLRIHQKTQKLNNTAHNYELFTTMEYDHAGRVKSIRKKLTNNGTAYPEKIIAEMAYDELGQLKTKKLAPGYNNNAGIETLVYDYNIRGWMLGMNRDYLLAEGQAGTAKFGFELGYDKPTNQTGQNFSSSVQYNGNIAGMAWKSDGDDVRRMYSFGYDGANRLLKGDFIQQNPDDHSWNNNRINYSMQMGNGTDGKTAYDANGNILAMTQYGWKPGANSAIPIDKLIYTYIDGSNRLKSVLDEVNDPMTRLGDFRSSATHPFTAYKTPANAWVQDYNYDANGNLIMDYNKDINNIAYNYLNLPVTIHTNNGTISYTYDAAGNKLEKKVTEGTILTITSYLGGAVYQSKGTTGTPGQDALQFIGMEEGRMRVDATNTSTPNPYDYMLKDHLGNVRMVLTDEIKQDVYPATTLENISYNGGTAISTEKNFYTIDETKIVLNTDAPGITAYQNNNGNPPYNNNPYSNTTASSERVYKLNASTNKTGLGIALKVMAGDVIYIYGKSYHKKPVGGYTNPAAPLLIADVLSAFTGTSVVGAKGITGSQISGQAGFPTTLAGLVGNQPEQTNDMVKASISWILFDEQFKYASGGYDPVGAEGGVKTHNLSTIPAITVTKNGYIYVYCSNESQYNVFFDNLQVIHNRGPILEETHYYPFGLTMAGISSKAANITINKEKTFQGQRFDDDLGLNWVQFKWRNHDPQIGRFIEIDPLSEKYEYNSTYAFSENKVTAHIELEGLEAVPIPYNRPKPYQNQTMGDMQIKKPPLLLNANVTKNPTPAGITLTVSKGKQVGIKVAGGGAELNFGSKEVYKVSNINTNNQADTESTTKGKSFSAGIVSISKEVSSKQVVTGTDFMGRPIEGTQSEVHQEMSIGIKKTPLSAGVERTWGVEQAYPSYSENITSDTGPQFFIGGSQSPGVGGSTRKGTEFSISAYYKIEVNINVRQVLISIFESLNRGGY